MAAPNLHQRTTSGSGSNSNKLSDPLAAFPMYPPDVVLHVVYAAEHPPALVLPLVASAVLLAGETATTRGAAPAAAGIGERASL